MIIDYKDHAWMVLQILRDYGPQGRTELNIGSEKLTSKSINQLIRAHFATTNIDGLVEITPLGVRELSSINASQEEPLPLAGKRTFVVKGNYEGNEMRRTCLRPGAYEAFEKPSLMSGKLYYRKEIKA